MNYVVTTFYKFTSLPKKDLSDIKHSLESRAAKDHVFGLVLIAEEGINATIAGTPSAIQGYKEYLEREYGALIFKDSESERMPFKRFKVKIKQEIVQLDRTDIRPTGSEVHLSPEEWDALTSQEDVVVIDVRNAYETKIGTFKNAIDPKTETFQQFPEWLKKSKIPTHQKIGIFCTGGIRCEKAAVAMKEQGYEQVYQLDGGILNYIEKRPHENFVGECFVFDHRVAVGQDLHPSKRYQLCRQCGNAGDIQECCEQCQANFTICEDCRVAVSSLLCSKNCRYHFNATRTKTPQ